MTAHFVNSLGYTAPIDVSLGGTGKSSFGVHYGVVCGGTGTSTPFQTIAALGTSGQVLTSNGSSALPTFQDLPASFPGTIVQVVYGSDTTTYTATFGSPAIGVSTTITPTSASNHILIMGSVSLSMVAPGPSPQSICTAGLYKGGFSLQPFEYFKIFYSPSAVGVTVTRRASVFYYDAPATTSAVTYTYVLDTQTSAAGYINQNGQLSNMILMEIAL